MSYTTVKAVWPGQRSEDLEELKNAWLGPMALWRALSEKWLGNPMAVMFNDKAFWPLWNDPRLPQNQRAVLLMTYDRFYVKQNDYSRAALDIRTTISELALEDSHWPRIAEIFESNPEAPAIGFVGTSVSEDLFHGEWNEELDDYDQPDWSKFESVYDEVKP